MPRAHHALAFAVLAGVALLAGCGSPSRPPDPGPTACGTAGFGPGDYTWTIDHGFSRTVYVHVPSGYDGRTPAAVVFNFHGYTSNAAQQAVYTEMIPKSDAAVFIAVHPEGAGSPQGWNAGDCCGWAQQNRVDDVGFVAATLDALEHSFCVDPRRVYATGFSNGAFLSHRLGCEMADRIAAIAPVAGLVGIPTCAPSRPVPVFDVHGTADAIVPYDGGGISNFPPVADTITTWRAVDGCPPTPVVTFQEGAVTCETTSPCTAGAAVTLCTVAGFGHGWPGSPLAWDNQDLSTTDALWDFFVAHPM